MAKQIILASRSPARLNLLKGEDLEVVCDYPDVDEARLPGEHVSGYAMRIAISKAGKVAERHSEGKIIAVDTVIAIGDEIFGKPERPEEAKRMLRALSGRWHEVYSGTVVMDAATGKIAKELVVTRVRFRPLTDEEIDSYIKTGEPMGSAGGYKIQGEGKNLIDKIEGSLTNVIGISVSAIKRMLV